MPHLDKYMAAKAAGNKSKSKKTSSKKYTTSSSAGGKKSQTDAGKKYVSKKLGLVKKIAGPIKGVRDTTSDVYASKLKGKDQKFFGKEASQATNEYLESIGEAKKGSHFIQEGGNFIRVSKSEYARRTSAGEKGSISYMLTSKGKEMKYGKSEGAMGSGDPSGIMSSTQISKPMCESQQKGLGLTLFALSFGAPNMLMGSALRFSGMTEYGKTYSDYSKKYGKYQSGEKQITASTSSSPEIKTSQIVGGTGISGETDAAVLAQTKKSKAGIIAGKAVKLRKMFV